MLFRSHYRPKADRYNVGERSNFILNPMMVAAITQLLDWGVDNIQNYCKNLLEEPLKILQEKGFWVEDEAFRANHLIGLRLPKGADIIKIQAEMKKRNVVISYRGEAVRISPNVYNDKADIDVMVEGLLAGL